MGRHGSIPVCFSILSSLLFVNRPLTVRHSADAALACGQNVPGINPLTRIKRKLRHPGRFLCCWAIGCNCSPPVKMRKLQTETLPKTGGKMPAPRPPLRSCSSMTPCSGFRTSLGEARTLLASGMPPFPKLERSAERKESLCTLCNRTPAPPKQHSRPIA